jgi:hypothetical protein
LSTVLNSHHQRSRYKDKETMKLVAFASVLVVFCSVVQAAGIPKKSVSRLLTFYYVFEIT